MSVMFVALFLSFYNFLIGPEGNGPQQLVYPFPVQMQIMSISGIPAIILTAVAFGMTRSYRSMLTGIILIAAGIMMVSGVTIANSIIPMINEEYIVGITYVIPYAFVTGGSAVTRLGIYLLAKSRSAPRLHPLEER
jgi:hypothetical protein